MKEYRINVLLNEEALRFIYAAVVEASGAIMNDNDSRKKEVDYFIRQLGEKIDQINDSQS